MDDNMLDSIECKERNNMHFYFFYLKTHIYVFFLQPPRLKSKGGM